MLIKERRAHGSTSTTAYLDEGVKQYKIICCLQHLTLMYLYNGTHACTVTMVGNHVVIQSWWGWPV